MLKRENSFLKQKQEQWAKEKAELEKTPEWFPFGENLRPGGGSPLRKFSPKNGSVSQRKYVENEKKEENEMQITPEKQTAAPIGVREETPSGEEKRNGLQYPFLIPLPYPYQLQNAENPWNFQYHIVPPNAIPVSTINLDHMDQLSAAMQQMWAAMPDAPPGMRIGIPIPPPTAPIDTPLPPPPTQHDQSISDGSSSASDSTSSFDYAQQMEERRRAERDAAARDAADAKRASEEHAELERRREAEEEFRRVAERARIDEDRRRSERFEAAVEKARKEAELLRKARLYRHVLDNAEEDLERKLLGVDEKTGQRLMKEVSEVERHKRQDEAEIQRNAPPRKRVETQRVRPSSTSGPVPISRNGFGRRSVRTTSREKEMLILEKGTDNSWRDPIASNSPKAIVDDGMQPTYYYPIDRSYSFSQEMETKPVNSLNRAKKQSPKNSITQTALFGPIPTRRSAGMRVPSLQSSPVGQMSSIGAVRVNSSDEEVSGSASVSPDLKCESPLPSSTENVHAKISLPNELNEKDHKAIRVRSALGSPSIYLNGGASLSRCGSPMMGKSRFLQKLEEKGTVTREEDITSENIRRLTEANRTPSSLSLFGSMQNLAIRGSMVNLSSNGELSPKLSKFRSMNSPARQSLTRLSKTSEKQAEVLDRLSRLRETLAHSKAVCQQNNNNNKL